MSPDAGGFGARLGACRESAGLTQEELAGRSGLSARTIRNLERGQTCRPHPDSARRLANALDLDAEARAWLIAAPVRPGPTLASDAAADGPPPAASPSGRSGAIVPRQLPAAVRHFVGRETELATLADLLNDSRPDGTGRPPATVITAIGGTAGVGKTALAVHWAHQYASRFPDGQLYVNLHGFDPSDSPAAAAEAIRGFLDALGVLPWRIPTGLEARTGLYRSLLAGRRMLILADNARDAAQVRPLLPGGRGCLVIVTSRSQLGGLAAADGAHLLSLDVFSEPEAAQFLALRLGARMAAEPEHAGELIGSCARLPLALSILAAQAAAQPRFPLAALAGALRDNGDRLDALDTGDAAASLRAVFSWSYRRLAGPAARMFRLISIHPGPDITSAVAAALAGIPAARARRALHELARASLVTEPAPGRYACHGLLRAYAAEQLACGEEDGREAAHRMLDYYLHSASSGAERLNLSHGSFPLPAPWPGSAPECFTDDGAARAWFEAEHQVLLTVIRCAAEAASGGPAAPLAGTLGPGLDRRGRRPDWQAVVRLAHIAAERCADRAS